MKKFLTIVAIATLSLSFGSVAMAQDAGPQGGQLQAKRHGGMGGGIKMMERIQKDVLASLTLTDDQKSKIVDLNKDLADKIKALMEQNKGTEGNKNLGAQRKTVMKDYNDQMHTILGPDLWKQYREGMLAKMKEAREKRKEHQQDKGTTPPAF
jgi:Spy/CpxP family protein refolding chaperone